MIDQTLNEEEGPGTFKVLQPAEEEPAEDSQDEGDQPKQETIRHEYIPNVILGGPMKFFDVPRLGSYLVVSLDYKSCLYENSFILGVENALDCRRQRAEQDQERINLAEQNSFRGSQKDEEGGEEEEKKFEEIVESPYETQLKRLVVCVDTLGQDRELQEEEINYVIDWVKLVKREWERSEDDALRHDIHFLIAQRDEDLQTIQDSQNEWAEEEKVQIEEFIKENEPIESEEERNLLTAQALLKVYRNRVLENGILNQFFDMKRARVIRHAKIFQIAFYYFGVRKRHIVEPGTNKIDWKRAKKLINSGFVNYLKYINPIGPKPIVPPAYAMTRRLEQELESITQEEVMGWSLALGFLYNFLKQCIAVRIADVTFRRNEYLAKKEARENAIYAAEELEQKRAQALEEARQAHENAQDQLDEDSDRKNFDEVEFLRSFDERESNKAVEIPPEVEPDQDGDLTWEETHPQKVQNLFRC